MGGAEPGEQAAVLDLHAATLKYEAGGGFILQVNVMRDGAIIANSVAIENAQGGATTT